jgi:hypothetical protein
MDNTETIKQPQYFYSTFALSVRRVNNPGLPGDDTSLYNIKIGSSLKGQGPLKGLDFEEEKKYLPELISISPSDVHWRAKANMYWNNIAVVVPADGTTVEKLQGRPMNFKLAFTSKVDRDRFEDTLDLEKKAEISKKGEVIDGIGDYILFRYCLVYGRVANSKADIHKTAKIRFYLFSKETETKNAHKALKQRSEASTLFNTLLDPTKEGMVNALLLMFKANLADFESLADKHLALEAFAANTPNDFINFINDGALVIKATIKKAVAGNIIHQPSNTDSYYYGDGNEVCLGTTLMDTVLYFKSTDEKKKQIVDVIKARLKQI